MRLCLVYTYCAHENAGVGKAQGLAQCAVHVGGAGTGKAHLEQGGASSCSEKGCETLYVQSNKLWPARACSALAAAASPPPATCSQVPMSRAMLSLMTSVRLACMRARERRRCSLESSSIEDARVLPCGKERQSTAGGTQHRAQHSTETNSACVGVRDVGGE